MLCYLLQYTLDVEASALYVASGYTVGMTDESNRS
jgi:hypothetical protein